MSKCRSCCRSSFFSYSGRSTFYLPSTNRNAATKAVQVGARIASVSNPVMTNLNALSAALASRTLRPGSAMPSFTVTCDGGTATCTCEGTCQVGGVIGFNAAALNTIVYGRGSSACGDATSSYTAGMCDVFNRITPANVRIEYRQFAAPAGLGYVGRPVVLRSVPAATVPVSLGSCPSVRLAQEVNSSVVCDGYITAFQVVPFLRWHHETNGASDLVNAGLNALADEVLPRAHSATKRRL